MCSELYAESSLGLATVRIPRADRVRTYASRVKPALGLFAAVLTAATLAACAQSSVTTDRSAAFHTAPRAAFGTRSVAARATPHRVAAIPRKHIRPNSPGRAVAQGDASFYEHDTETASGEKFDPHKLTAAHPTLPFGTRLRITNMVNGRSVTVRINDRGPYVAGRVVDLSYSAAEKLKMTERGVVKVKMDVVQ